jgi:phage terminase large subunit GpA-like protein
LGDEYYRQITSEMRIVIRERSGATTSKWVLVDPSRRNEGLDTMNYATAAALRKGWGAMTNDQWAALDLIYGQPPKENQGDLFDAAISAAPAVAVPAGPRPSETAPAPRPVAGTNWLSGRIRSDD